RALARHLVGRDARTLRDAGGGAGPASDRAALARRWTLRPRRSRAPPLDEPRGRTAPRLEGRGARRKSVARSDRAARARAGFRPLSSAAGAARLRPPASPGRSVVHPRGRLLAPRLLRAQPDPEGGRCRRRSPRVPGRDRAAADGG